MTRRTMRFRNRRVGPKGPRTKLWTFVDCPAVLVHQQGRGPPHRTLACATVGLGEQVVDLALDLGERVGHSTGGEPGADLDQDLGRDRRRLPAFPPSVAAAVAPAVLAARSGSRLLPGGAPGVAAARYTSPSRASARQGARRAAPGQGTSRRGLDLRVRPAPRASRRFAWGGPDRAGPRTSASHSCFKLVARSARQRNEKGRNACRKLCTVAT